jgi:hypothetical protein
MVDMDMVSLEMIYRHRMACVCTQPNPGFCTALIYVTLAGHAARGNPNLYIALQHIRPEVSHQLQP